MSMKKEIKKMLNSEGGNYKINNFCYLKYRTKDWKDDKLSEPRLELDFYALNGETGHGILNAEIKSRDYDGIMLEASELIKEYFEEVAYKLCQEIKGGHAATNAEFEPIVKI